VLDVASNRIRRIEGVVGLTHLEEFWANNNFIADFRDLEILSKTRLKTLYLEHNPVQKDARYRASIMSALPHLIQLDADTVRDES